MIYASRLFGFVVLALFAIARALRPASISPTGRLLQSLRLRQSDASSSSRRYAVPEWLTESPNSGEVDRGSMGMVTVRFVNTVSGKDVVVEVEPGSNLLFVGDSNGVPLPRACRTGLCGSCTCEVKDPEAVKTATNPRDGFATIRACSTKCFVPEGMNEMVVDVYRMKERAEAEAMAKSGRGKATATVATYTDPMARFSDNWEKDFRPQWELEKSQLAIMTQTGQGQVGVASDPKNRSCKKCGGLGRLVCYNCEGTGRVSMGGSANKLQCPICVGQLTCGCGFCRGTGINAKK